MFPNVKKVVPTSMTGVQGMHHRVKERKLTTPSLRPSCLFLCLITSLITFINCFYLTSLLPEPDPPLLLNSRTLVTPEKKQQLMDHPYSIPRELLFIDTRYNEISEMPKHVVQNVNRTISLFRNLWNKTDAPVNFLGNKQCLDAINASKSELIPYYQTEPKGMYKSDICRAAILYLTGGYYFDNDMQIIQALSLPKNITYATAMEYGDKGHFVSFVFTMKGHPILNNTLQLMADYYQGRKKITNQLGPALFKEAYDSQPNHIKAASKILRETRLEREPRYRNVPKLQGVGCCCNFVVEDTQAKKIVFYSRMVGAGINCDYPKSGTSHGRQSDSLVRVSAQREKQPKTGGSSSKTCCVNCPFTKDQYCGGLWKGIRHHGDSVGIKNVTIHVVVTHCKFGLDWMDDYLQGFDVSSITILSKCGNEVIGAPKSRILETLPNVGRCDHTYAHYVTSILGRLINKSDPDRTAIVFLKDSIARKEGGENSWNSFGHLVKEALGPSGVGCGQTPRNDFSVLHDLSALSKFQLQEWHSLTSMGTNEKFKSSFQNLGAFVRDGLGMKLKEDIVHVCYSGVFSAKLSNILAVDPVVLQKAEKLLSRGDNIEEGHFMERLWAALFASPLDQFQIRGVRDYSNGWGGGGFLGSLRHIAI